MQRVIVERPPFNVRDYLWTGTMGVLGAVSQLTLVTDLMNSGETFTP